MKVEVDFKDFWHDDSIEAIQSENLLYQFLGKKYEITITEDAPLLIYSVFGIEHLRYKKTKIFYTAEKVSPDFDECDYAFSFDVNSDPRNFTLPLFRLYPAYDEIKICDWERVPLEPKKKFCNFLYSNWDATERLDFLVILNKYKHVDVGGRVYSNVKMPIDDKRSFQSQYKFTIAFENFSSPGYVTEKILDAFAARSLPIYWGAPNITDFFNPKSFINVADFSSFADAVEYVREVDNDDDLYLRYLRSAKVNEPQWLSEEAIFSAFDSIFTSNHETKVAAGLAKYWVRKTKQFVHRQIVSSGLRRDLARRKRIERNTRRYITQLEKGRGLLD